MDMEEIILEHIKIREWVDNFVKEVIKKDKNNKAEESPCLHSYVKL